MSLSFSIFIVYLIVFGWGCMIYWRLRGLFMSGFWERAWQGLRFDVCIFLSMIFGRRLSYFLQPRLSYLL